MIKNKDATETHDNLGKIYFDQLWDSRFKDCRLFGLIVLILEIMQTNITIFNPSIDAPPSLVDKNNKIRRINRVKGIPGDEEINLAQNVLNFIMAILLLSSFRK